jgi:undecaprenyl-phosphate 4-deoxy-4-formamido-L-arabinose transferase
MNNNNNLISIIIPTYKGEKSIELLCNEILYKFKSYNVELILINDNSPDNTHQICLDLIKTHSNSNITYIKLGKNFGEHNAVLAGLKNCSGDLALIMDDDFQNPTNEAIKLLDYSLKNNFDVVYGNYIEKKHSLIRNIISKVNNISANIILEKPKNLYLSSFKTIKRKIIDQITLYSGPYPYIDGLILSATSNISSLNVRHEERGIEYGKSGYNILKLFKLYSNLIGNFSTKPIHICSITGVFITILSVLFAIYLIIDKIVNPNITPGYSSIVILIIFFSGIQLIFIGLIGEYVGKILKNVNNSKAYYIELIKRTKDPT